MAIRKNTEVKDIHSKYYWNKLRNLNIKHFQLSEFDSPDDIGSGENMDTDFLIRLDRARDLAGVPFKVNSGYRTFNHNKKIGGIANSFHMNIPCNAADIAAKDSINRYVILSALLKAGFTRIGIGKNFIHCDTDKLKSQRICWHYY